MQKVGKMKKVEKMKKSGKKMKKVGNGKGGKNALKTISKVVKWCLLKSVDFVPDNVFPKRPFCFQIGNTTPLF